MYVFGALVGFLFISLFFKNKKMKKARDLIMRNWAVLLALGFAVGVGVDMAGYDSGPVYDECISFVGAMLLSFPVSIGYMVAHKKQKAIDVSQTEDVFTLSADERIKIVSKFNDKYGLNLTYQQIQSIVYGSFDSREWAEEVMAMSQSYDSIYGWYAGDREWIRAYLKVFNVQNISADFRFQKEICLNNFTEVFSGIEIETCHSIEECIGRMNYKYLTNFDDATFMFAYRFLQANGREFRLPNLGIVKNVNEIDSLLEKYKKEEESGYIRY